jgi:hypothetical protein
MTLIGSTMMGEPTGPKQPVRDAALAEQAGFDFAVISDHYFPWLEVQGHAPYARSVLGAAAQTTAVQRAMEQFRWFPGRLESRHRLAGIRGLALATKTSDSVSPKLEGVRRHNSPERKGTT